MILLDFWPRKLSLTHQMYCIWSQSILSRELILTTWDFLCRRTSLRLFCSPIYINVARWCYCLPRYKERWSTRSLNEAEEGIYSSLNSLEQTKLQLLQKEDGYYIKVCRILRPLPVWLQPHTLSPGATCCPLWDQLPLITVHWMFEYIRNMRIQKFDFLEIFGYSVH
jgi:hypothetical protein